MIALAGPVWVAEGEAVVRDLSVRPRNEVDAQVGTAGRQQSKHD